MNPKKRFVDRYKEGTTPWVHSVPDFNLVEIIENWPIQPCSVLELGCGTGVEAIWLANQGFSVTALDGSPIAIDIARKSALEVGVDCNFIVQDFIDGDKMEDSYDFIFDRGFFHSFRTETERSYYAKRVSGLLNNRGVWLTLMGNADAPPRETGPPMRTAKEIIEAIEPYFSLLTLTVSYFGNDEENPAKNWVCLMRKR